MLAKKKWLSNPILGWSISTQFCPFREGIEQSNFQMFKCPAGGRRGDDETLNWLMHYCSGFHGMYLLHSDQYWTKTFQHSFAYPTNILGLTFSLVGHWLHLGWEGVASKIHSRTVLIVLQYNNLSASTTNHINSCIQQEHYIGIVPSLRQDLTKNFNS